MSTGRLHAHYDLELPSEAEMTQCELPPGPAFVLATRLPRGIGDLMRWENWKEQNVPLGYIFRPATDCTPAGWVRPMGKE